MNIVVLGLPGAGKGTQSRRLSSDFCLFYFEAGGFLRQVAKKDTEVKKIVNSGKLVPDRVMGKKVFSYLEENNKYEKGVLFDGYPRSLLQWRYLTEWLSQKGKKVDLVLFLDLPVREAVKRLSSRRICPECGRVYNLITDPPKNDKVCDICKIPLYRREDDSEKVIRERFREQKKFLLPLVDSLKKQGNFFVIDASQSIQEVYEDMVAVVRRWYEGHDTD